MHCNVGWKGSQNGYYISGVFAMDENRGELITNDELGRSVAPEVLSYFQFDLTQANMLKPKR